MKLTLKILAIIVGILILVPILIFLFLDPNMFKPVIEKQAGKQGIYLDLKDLDWTLWPEFGVEAKNITVSPLASKNEPLATLASASFLIQVKPLFHKEFFIDHISIDSAEINLKVDKDGRGNWQSIIDTMQSSSPETPQKPPIDEKANGENEEQGDISSIDLDINTLSFTNSQLSYDNRQTNQKLLIENLTFKLSDVNLDGQPMPMQFEALSTFASGEKAAEVLKINASLDQVITFGKDFNRASLQDGLLVVSVFDGDSQKHEDIKINYALNLNNLNTDLSYKGNISISQLNAKKILGNLDINLDSKSSYALTNLELSADINGDSTRAAVNPLKLQIDKTNISGYANIIDFSTNRFQVDLKGDQINIDDYLPESEEKPQTADTEKTADTEIPMEVLRNISGIASLQFKQATIMEIPFKDIIFSLKAEKGIINIEKVETTAFEGRVHADAVVDARGDKAMINFSSKVSDFSLEPFFKYLDFSEKFNFTGLVNLTANGKTQGQSTNQLTDGLLVDAKVQGDQVKFFPLNLEEQFCKLVDLINQNEKTTKNWQDFSEMQSLLTNIHYQDNKISINTLNAGIANLLLASDGNLNLAEDKYKINLPLKLQDSTATKGEMGRFKTSQNGCAIQSNYWVTRGLTLLECKGSVSGLNPLKDCRPNESELKNLIKDYASYKVKQKHGDDIKELEQKADTKKEKLKDDFDQKLKEKAEEKKLEEKLKNIFGKDKES